MPSFFDNEETEAQEGDVTANSHLAKKQRGQAQGYLPQILCPYPFSLHTSHREAQCCAIYKII